MINSLRMHRIKTWNAQSLEIYCWLQHIKDVTCEINIPCHKNLSIIMSKAGSGGEERRQSVCGYEQIRHRAQSGSFCLLSQRSALGRLPRHIINY